MREYPSAGRTVVQDGLTLICLTGVDEDHDPCNTHASWRLGHALSFVCGWGSFCLYRACSSLGEGEKTPRSGFVVVDGNSGAYERVNSWAETFANQQRRRTAGCGLFATHAHGSMMKHAQQQITSHPSPVFSILSRKARHTIPP